MHDVILTYYNLLWKTLRVEVKINLLDRFTKIEKSEIKPVTPYQSSHEQSRCSTLVQSLQDLELNSEPQTSLYQFKPSTSVLWFKHRFKLWCKKWHKADRPKTVEINADEFLRSFVELIGKNRKNHEA